MVPSVGYEQCTAQSVAVQRIKKSTKQGDAIFRARGSSFSVSALHAMSFTLSRDLGGDTQVVPPDISLREAIEF